MGDFIGGVGAAFIVAAAVCVIAKFLLDTGVIKNKDTLIGYGKVSLKTIIIGVVYMFIIALIYNELKERTNFFDFKTIYRFLDMESVLSACESPAAKELFGGILMPLYPLMSYALGSVMVGQYMHAAMYINFAAACVTVCGIYDILKERLGADKAWDIIYLLLSLPFAFLLFSPSYVALTAAFAVTGVKALIKGKNALYWSMVIAAVLTSKLGVLVIAAYPLHRLGVFSAAANFADRSRLLNNGIAVKILLSILLLVSGMIICCLVRGI